MVRGGGGLHIHSSSTNGGGRQCCCLGYFVSQEQVWLIDELWAQQQAAMLCHLGPSQGKYCDRAFTFVPFPRLELDHTTGASPPQKTHIHMERRTDIENNPPRRIASCQATLSKKKKTFMFRVMLEKKTTKNRVRSSRDRNSLPAL